MLIHEKSIKEITIVGNIQENINKDKFKKLLDSNKINVFRQKNL